MKSLRKFKKYLVSVLKAAFKVEETIGARLAVFFDILFCQLRFHTTVDEYLLYHFYNYKNRYRKNFLLKHHKLHQYRRVNNVDITRDKYRLYEKLSDFYCREVILVPDCGAKAFLDFVKKHNKVILKPNRGSLGKGVCIVEYQNDEQILHYFSSIEKEMVCEEYVRQNKALSQLHPSSVNTLRIVSIRHNENDVEIACATLKMGAQIDAAVDNMGCGGLIAQVDTATGIVLSCGLDKKKNRYTHHPISKVQIVGMNIPNWAAVVDLVKKAHTVLDENRVVGWDIAVTETGALVIEANSAPSPNIMQMIDCVPQGDKILKVLNNKKYHIY